MRATVKFTLAALVPVLVLGWIVADRDASPTTVAATSTAGTVRPGVAPAVTGPARAATASGARTAAGADQRAQLVAVAGVVDGDTLRVWVGGQRVRLRVIGIDTPERGECGFQVATSRMQSLAQSGQVRIEADPTQGDKDSYDRILRHVFTPEGGNIARQLISEGLGREYTYAKPYAYQAEYRAAQARAQQAGAGLWAPDACGRSTAARAPGVVAPRSSAPAPPAACDIKGNISISSGEKIYHVPGQQHYAETRIDPSDGERWFCTEAEAVAAGWRKARR